PIWRRPRADRRVEARPRRGLLPFRQHELSARVRERRHEPIVVVRGRGPGPDASLDDTRDPFEIGQALLNEHLDLVRDDELGEGSLHLERELRSDRARLRAHRLELRARDSLACPRSVRELEELTEPEHRRAKRAVRALPNPEEPRY